MIASGNVSDATKWDGGVATPAVGDTCVANGFTGTIDVAFTVVQIRTLALGAGASGGGWVLNDGITLTANVLAGTTTCLTYAGNGANVGTVVGSVTGSAATASVNGASMTGTGTLAVTGAVTGGGATSALGISNSSTGTVTVTGNVTGGSGASSFGINATAAGTVTVTGNVAPGSSGIGVNNNSTGTITVTGDVASGVNVGILNVSTGTVTVTGNVTGSGSSNVSGISNSSTGTVTVTGNVTGGSVGTSYGILSGAAANIAIKGTITAGTAFGAHGIFSSSTGHMHVEGDIVGVATGAQAGTMGVSCRIMAMYQASTRKWGIAEAAGAMPGTPTGYSGTLVYLYGASNAGSSSGQAGVANVRKNTVYGASNEFTGLAYIPAAASVLFGVNVDQTTGLATLAAADIRAAIGMAAANLDTQLSTIDDFLDTEVVAIKAKTDNIPSDPADASDIAAAFSTVNATLVTIAGYIDTEVAAIKAKTDSLTFTTAGKVDAKLTSDGLDDIAITAPAGVAGTFREMIVQVWRRFFKRHTKNKAADSAIKTYADNGTSVLTTQAYTTTDGDDVGAAT